MSQNIFSPEEYKKEFKKNPKSKKESSIQIQVCDYLKKHYPDVIFNCDIASGMNLGARIGGMNTRFRSSRAIPDIFISEPRGGYHGLFLELKRDGVVIFLKNGNITKNPHIREQWEMLNRLSKKDYKAVFAVGKEEAISIIDNYMNLEKS